MVKSSRRTRKSGGGWSMGSPLSPTSYYVPEYKSFNDCYALARPGSIQSNPNPALAQTKMAGGKRTKKNKQSLRGSKNSRAKNSRAKKSRGKKQHGGCGCAMKKGGSRTRRRQGSCGYYGAKGGRYVMDTSQSIGGDGPNVAPIYSNFPCEAPRPMALNPVLPTMLADSPSPDINVSGLRPAFIQAGGAPLSLAYNAPRAGFSFQPNISQGQVIHPGQIPYNNVVPQQTTGAGSCGQAINLINKMN